MTITGVATMVPGDPIMVPPQAVEPIMAPIVIITGAPEQARPGAGILPPSNSACPTELQGPAHAMGVQAHDPEGEDSVNRACRKSLR